MDYLSKKILQKPNALSIKKVQTDESYITEANDLFYIEDKTLSSWVSWALGGFLLIFSLFGFLIEAEDEPIAKIVVIGAFGLSGIFGIVYGFFTPQKYMTMDRLNNKITIPRSGASSVNIVFETAFGLIKYRNSSPGVISGFLALQSRKKWPRVEGKLTTDHDNKDFWNFTIWYMDKNRPLPPGTAFDPYREKDFERRKAEGFPKPLYPSNITTNEATREQQKERELIGGW